MNPSILDELVESLRARTTSPDGLTAPVAVLWPDPKQEWHTILPALRSAVPELLVLGDYDPDVRTGPAIWLRCVVDGTLPDWSDGSANDGGASADNDSRGDSGDCNARSVAANPVPVLYLPGVHPNELRAAGPDCPDHLKPLLELMYRGTIWRHPNGRPWTPVAFLRNSTTLGLDIASDPETSSALAGALAEVALFPTGHFEGQRWDAHDFNQMLAPDLERDVLRWMADPHDLRDRLSDHRWRAFRDRCQGELDLDPETDSDVTAGAKLSERQGRWALVWKRFSEAPAIHLGVVDVLRRSRPAGEIALEPERWPDLNDQEEARARDALAEIPGRSAERVRITVAELERQHGPRREWLWASLGHSPVAHVLEPLAALAEATAAPIGGATPSDAADTYANGGWHADRAAREALARSIPQDEFLVAKVVGRLLEPWLEASTRAFQAAVESASLPGTGDSRADRGQPLVEADEDQCLVFVDGLRYELACDLAARLEAKGCKIEIARRWAALPTVTATGKAAVTPVADRVSSEVLGPDFLPVISEAEGGASDANQRRPADAARLRKTISESGYQVLGDTTDPTLDLPLRPGARGWTEVANIDKRGHAHAQEPRAFARALEDELELLVQRIVELLEAGWRSIRVVTDHGWLWMPGGLPMVSLPRHLVASSWARCATVAGESRPGSARRFAWHWNAAQWFATPPGIACFRKRDAYAHGGVSLQECLIPDIRVEPDDRPRAGPSAVIHSVMWHRLRCFVEVEATGGIASVDLRLSGPSGPSVVAAAKPVSEEGSASLLVASDEHEGDALVLVVCDADGRVLAHQSTRTGAVA